jgi:hypothetical protein
MVRVDLNGIAKVKGAMPTGAGGEAARVCVVSRVRQNQWGKWLDRIGEHFGELRIAQFDPPEKIRPVLVRFATFLRALQNAQPRS